jgi:hypothetical protein
LIVGGAFLLFPARHACGISRRHFSRKWLELISVQEAAPTKGVHAQKWFPTGSSTETHQSSNCATLQKFSPVPPFSNK